MPENPERVHSPSDGSAGQRGSNDILTRHLSDLQGARQLAVEGVLGVTDVVEAMHRNIAGFAPIIGEGRKGRTRGITGFVYRSIRLVSRLTGMGTRALLRSVRPLLRESEAGHAVSRRREAVVAALNGVFGDHLAVSNNPLAIPMQMRAGGRPIPVERQALRRHVASPSPPLVLLHGLCMNDLQWRRDGHDHGTALARDLGYTPLWLHYNTGKHIYQNGREFAHLMERLVREWPEPVQEVAMIGHSMGGLVARSACHYAIEAGHTWPERLKTLVFLGTPHHGAPLERAGQWVDRLLDKSPYTEPISRIGQMRSAGINDLCHGVLVDADGEGAGTNGDPLSVPLPEGTACFAAAAALRVGGKRSRAALQNDGLVPVASALGEHDDPERSLAVPPSRQRVYAGLSHFDLLRSRDVYGPLRRWIGEADQERR